MSETTLYIAGPMTGVPDWNYPAFFHAERQLKAAGYRTLNPARHGEAPGMSWSDYMRLGIADVVAADGVAVLPSWLQSRGAWLEVTVARSLEMRVADVEEWVTAAGEVAA